jgi:hypothetical protein
MVKAVLCASLFFAAVEGRCSCDATPASATERPILLPPVNSSATPSPISSIGAVAKQNEDWSKTMQQILDAAANMAGQLAAGKMPSEDDLLKSVGALVVEGAGMVNPILGGLASIIYSFFQGLFGSSTNEYRALYDMIMNQVAHMIAESEIRTKMGLVKDSIEGYIGEADYLSRTGQQPKADYFYLNMPTVLDSQCLAKDWNAQSCVAWEQHGAVVHSVLFATLHLQTLNEIAASYHGDQSQVNTYLQEIANYGEKYVTILRHSLDTWHKHRMQQQNLNFYNPAVGGNCFINHQGDCYAHSADHYGATVEGCPACDFCIVDVHEEPYKTRTVQWHNAWSTCHSNHRSKLQDTMNQVSKAIDGIAELAATAKKVSPPAPAPLPKFADRLLVGQTLTEGNLIVSSNGWNRLVMQTDGNLVIYADNYDGYNSDGAKSTWATGQAGAGAQLSFQTDGNVVLYGGGGVKWSSNTVGKGGQNLIMQGDGNLCLYPSSGSAIWCSNTRTLANSSVTLV